MISKEIVIKTIHQFFYEQIKKTPLITDEDGEHYITAKVEPFLEMNKGLSRLIKSIPDQDRHGRWKHTNAYPNIIFCDECGEPFEKSNSSDKWNYCPNCGAEMESEK